MDAIGQWLQDTGIVMLNGLLAVLYFVWEQGPIVASLVIAAMVMAWPDRSVQKVAGHRPRRRHRGSVVKASPVAMIATAVTAAVWAVACGFARPRSIPGPSLWFRLCVVCAVEAWCRPVEWVEGAGVGLGRAVEAGLGPKQRKVK